MSGVVAGQVPAVDPALLRRYDLSATRGFVPDQPPVDELPGDLAVLDRLAAALPRWMAEGGLPAAVADLPPLDATRLELPEQRERALLVLTALAAAVVHGAGGTGDRLPAPLAVPLVALARAMGRQPIPSWSNLGPRNWVPLGDPGVAPGPRTARLQVRFTDLDDEHWFFLGTLAVEVAGGRLPARCLQAVAVARGADDDELADVLRAVAMDVDAATAALDVLREGCRPEVFHARVRTGIAGWGPGGVVYHGVSDEPVVLVGATAAQSPLVAVVDELLGVEHPGATGDFLRGMRAYVSPEQRALLHDVGATSTVRARVASGGRALSDAYEAAVGALEGFRKQHMRLVHDYVVVPSRTSADEAVGTGGTTVSGFLRESRVDTRRARPPIA